MLAAIPNRIWIEHMELLDDAAAVAQRRSYTML
jgi:hypothetical protein